MTSMQPLWWFALPLLLLPVWWHMRKRERTRTDFLATARFLPTALPQQQRVLRWSDVPLLLARLALLLALIAWMAVLAMPWKGDTVFVVAALERSAWAEQQIAAAGMSSAARQPLPDDAWNWLARNEHEWRPEARFLVLAPASTSTSAAMPALPPRLAHATDLRIAPAAPAPTAAPRERQVVVVASADRLQHWQALFAAFSTAADGANRYALTDTPTSQTELIVWDNPAAEPPAAWKAQLWWRTAAATAQTQSAQGLIWTAPQWPLQDIDAARTLYERWQAATARPTAHTLPAQKFSAAREKPLPTTLARSPEWLAIALLALFAIERTLTHVRRRS